MVELATLKLSHLPNAHDTFIRAFKDDPVQRYLWEDDKRSEPWRRAGRKLSRAFRLCWIWAVAITWGITFEIDGGKAFVIGALAKNTSQIRFFIETIASLVLGVLEPCTKALSRAYNRAVLTPSQYRRINEAVSKMEETVSRVLGDEANDFMRLDFLACLPEKQGHGYGRALVCAVTQIAHMQDRKVWLFSSNIQNNRFYRNCRFKVVAEFTLGESDPLWCGEPVVVQMMVYEPKKRD